jgi:DNA repair protein RAD50
MKRRFVAVLLRLARLLCTLTSNSFFVFLQLKDQTTPLAQKKKKKEADKLRLRAVANEEEQSLRATIDQFSLDVKYLRDLTRQIDDYSRSNKADELDQVASQASKVLERIEQQKKALSSLQPEVDSVRAAVNDQERHKKQLKENVELLHAEQRTNELQEEIDDLETKLKNVDGQETCYAKHTEAKARKEQQLASKARTEGRWSEIVEQIRSLKVSGT